MNKGVKKIVLLPWENVEAQTAEIIGFNGYEYDAKARRRSNSASL